MKRLAGLAALWVCSASAAVADPAATTNAPPAAPTNLVTSPASPLDPMAEAISFLRSRYVDFTALTYKPGDQLPALVARSNGGIYLLPAQGPIVSATLPGDVLYWRLGSFTPSKDWPELGAQLHADGLIGVVLDLRSSEAVNDPGGESQLLSLLVPKSSTTQVAAPAVPLPVAVLVNSHTAGTAEELAARLKASGALIIGEPTAGRGVVFAEDKLSSGQILFAESAQPPAEHASVQPDIALPADDWSEQAALAQVAANHVGDVVQESPPRHRMSEAALVQGQDPEWDAYLEAMKKKPDAHFLLSLPPIHDAALITAMDSLKAIRITQVPPPVTAKPEAPTPPASLQ